MRPRCRGKGLQIRSKGCWEGWFAHPTFPNAPVPSSVPSLLQAGLLGMWRERVWCFYAFGVFSEHQDEHLSDLQIADTKWPWKRPGPCCGC